MTATNVETISPKKGHESPPSPAPSHLEDGKPRYSNNVDEDEEFSYKQQRAIVHRIDRRLVVSTGLMYCVSLIDRGNMPNAAVAGMHDELGTNIGFRYVSSGLTTTRVSANNSRVYCLAGLLRYVYALSATSHGLHPQNWP